MIFQKCSFPFFTFIVCLQFRWWYFKWSSQKLDLWSCSQFIQFILQLGWRISNATCQKNHLNFKHNSTKFNVNHIIYAQNKDSPAMMNTEVNQMTETQPKTCCVLSVEGKPMALSCIKSNIYHIRGAKWKHRIIKEVEHVCLFLPWCSHKHTAKIISSSRGFLLRTCSSGPLCLLCCSSTTVSESVWAF